MSSLDQDYKALCYHYQKLYEDHKALYHRYKHLYDDLYEVMNRAAQPEPPRVIRWTSPKKTATKGRNAKTVAHSGESQA
jgi:CRISPR/Cas system CSM-associated protein Csm4 (group 5 of RAMP superfamily)